jgi:hypothetical protein
MDWFERWLSHPAPGAPARPASNAIHPRIAAMV